MKKLLICILFSFSMILYGQQLINVGSSPNDKTGDALRTAFQKVNTNLTAIYDSLDNRAPLTGTASGLTAGGIVRMARTPLSYFNFYSISTDPINVSHYYGKDGFYIFPEGGTYLRNYLDTTYLETGTVKFINGNLGYTTGRLGKGWFTDLDVTNVITGSITGNAATVTGYTPASGSLTLSGADAITLTTTAATSVTLPTSGTLATTNDVNGKLAIADTNAMLNNYLHNSMVSSIEAGYLNGVTSNIQTQISNISAGSSASWNIVNVKDHGAVGDGTTPDADSINAQIADNTILFIPSGTYLIDTILRFTGLVNFKMIGENGTTFLINESTNGPGNYGCILISGITENVEISKTNFRVTASYTADEQPPIIYVGNSTSSTTNLSINNCKFHAPSIDMNAVYMLGNTGIYNNIKFIENEVDSIGRCGIEYWENGYANAYDSSSFYNVVIKDNHFSNTGLYGNYGMPISIAGNDADISNNYIYNHRKNQAIETGHSYRLNVHNNIIFSRFSSNAISFYQGYQFTITDNVITFTVHTATAIGLNECEDFSVNNNTIRAYKNGISFLTCSRGMASGNVLRINRTTGIWIDDANSNLMITGNKITMIDATDQYGAIRISKSDNGVMSNTYGNIVQDNIITTGQAGTKFVVYNVNRSLNTVTEGSLIKTKTLTIGVTGNTQADKVFDLTQANTTEQVLTFTDILPSNCRIIAFEMVCVTSVAGSGSTELTLHAGTSSSGEELVAAASTNTMNEVRGVIDAGKLPAIAMYWNEAVDQYSFRSIYITGTPTANWNTLSAGKWIALMTYIDYRYK